MHPLSFLPAANLSPLVESAFRGLLLAVIVSVGLKLLHVGNVVVQKTAWLCVLLCAFAMPFLSPLALQLPIPDSATAHLFLHRTQRIAATTVATPITPIITEFRTVKHIGPVTDADDSSSTPALPRFGNNASGGPGVSTRQNSLPQVRPAAPILTRPQFLFLLYTGVCLVLLFRLLRGTAVALNLWRAAETVDAKTLPDFEVTMPIRCTPSIASPINIASGILLPADYPSWDREKLNIVLAHEASHVRQRDFYLQLAAQLYAAIFWFSPLGWWMGRKLSDLSEAISDRAGLTSAANPAAYAQVLLEFAALTRPTPTGVAMARPGRLTQRIERLLNESSFREAFSSTRIRTAATLLLIPAALFAATALVRVQAAQVPQTPAVPPPPAAEPAQKPATPDLAPSPEGAAKSQPAPAAPDLQDSEAPNAAIATPGPIILKGSAQQSGAGVLVLPRAGGPSYSLTLPGPIVVPNLDVLTRNASQLAMLDANRALVSAKVQAEIARAMAENGPLGYWLGSNADPYVIVRRADSNGLTVHVPKTRTWHNMYDSMDEYKSEIDKAKTVAHGDFIWFRRDGKSYVIDDPAVLAQLEPMQDKIDELGKQQQALGKQQEALGKQQEELGRQMEQVKVPTPDMQKELAKLKAVQAKLAALQGTDATQQQLSEIQNELAEVQGRIGAIQGNMGGRMGDLGGKMGALGGEQGKLGAEQGRLGAEQGRLARELDGKVLTIIDESLKNGKAKPVK